MRFHESFFAFQRVTQWFSHDEFNAYAFANFFILADLLSVAVICCLDFILFEATSHFSRFEEFGRFRGDLALATAKFFSLDVIIDVYVVFFSVSDMFGFTVGQGKMQGTNL